MAWVSNWINSELQAIEAELTVEDTLIDTVEHKGILEKYMPIKIYSDFDFVNWVIEKIIPTASVVAYGSELPNETFGNFQKITGELFKAGLSFTYDEKIQKAIKQAMELAALRNIAVQNIVLPTGEVINGSNNTLAELLFGSISTMAEALTRLLKVHSWQAVQFGVINYLDPLTGARNNLDYRDPTATYGYAPFGKYAHFPNALTGGDRWTEYASANPLQDLRGWTRVYKRTTGRRPDAVCMSEDAWDHLKLCESTKQAYSSIISTAAGVTVSAAGLMDDIMVENLMKRLKLPMPIIQDEMYWTRDENKKKVKRRYLNENRICFLSKGLGEQAMGPTMENDGATGPYVVVREIRNFPPVDAIQGVATMLPVIPNPKLLFAIDVYDV